MSYMNHLEKKMRYSNAFSSLNSFRNYIAVGKLPGMDIVDKSLLLDAIEIAVDKTKESFKKALRYGFYNTGDTVKSSALELAKVINEGISRKVINETDIRNIRVILNEEAEVAAEMRLTEKIDSLMVLLNKAKKEEVPTSKTLLVKSFNF